MNFIPGSHYTGQPAQWDEQGLPINIEAALCDTLRWLMHAQSMGCWQKTSNRQALAGCIRSRHRRLSATNRKNRAVIDYCGQNKHRKHYLICHFS